MESALLVAAPYVSQSSPALERQALQIAEEFREAFKGGGAAGNGGEGVTREDLLWLHALHRRRLYLSHARELSHFSDNHYFYKLLMWCHDHHLFIHPALRMAAKASAFRDHVFTVASDVAAFTPLLAVPEQLVIGFRDPAAAADADDAERTALYDAKKEKEFHQANVGEGAEADICEFFFSSLSMIVSELFTARSSALTDPRHLFADLLSKVRTLQNAPYFDDDVVFDATEPCLADVLLQMIRNYINGGPLVNKVTRQELQWAVSLCLSHSTPLSIGAVKSIGIIPMVHLFPHGGASTNAYVVARTARESSARKMAAFFRRSFGYDFAPFYGGKWIYVVPERALRAGEEVRLQAMAPVCEKDSEEEAQMWRLSCGTVPSDYKTSAEVAAKQRALTEYLINEGGKAL